MHIWLWLNGSEMYHYVIMQNTCAVFCCSSVTTNYWDFINQLAGVKWKNDNELGNSLRYPLWDIPSLIILTFFRWRIRLIVGVWKGHGLCDCKRMLGISWYWSGNYCQNRMPLTVTSSNGGTSFSHLKDSRGICDNVALPQHLLQQDFSPSFHSTFVWQLYKVICYRTFRNNTCIDIMAIRCPHLGIPYSLEGEHRLAVWLHSVISICCPASFIDIASQRCYNETEAIQPWSTQRMK